MCGRFTQDLTWQQFVELYGLESSASPPNLRPRYNGAPSQDFAACRLGDGGNRSVTRLHWGLVPAGGEGPRMGARLINARAETVHTKPSFGAAFRSRRCLVPANGWFEWQRSERGRQPYFLALADGSPLSFAALWECGSGDGESLESFTIITTASCPALADIHHRQPAVIDPDRFDEWLDPASPIPLLLDWVREPCGGPYERRAVGSRVNNARNDDPDILEPTRERSLF